MSALLDAALGYAARGWPVLPCARKVPRAKHGVNDASTDPDVIRDWWTTWPLADIAIATGHPGPTVIDLDDPRAVPDLVAGLDKLGGPCAATGRGLHYYCRGQARGTVKLAHGEVRGAGGYVCCPPSVHPTGRIYTWLVDPDAVLPDVPAALLPTDACASVVGAGDQALVDQVVPGGMNEHLVDLAVRLARAGVFNADVVERVLVAEFEATRVPGAIYGGDSQDTRRIAEWANSCDIADRERALDDFAARWGGRP